MRIEGKVHFPKDVEKEPMSMSFWKQPEIGESLHFDKTVWRIHDIRHQMTWYGACLGLEIFVQYESHD